MIEERLIESIELKQRILSDRVLIERIKNAAEKIIECYKNNGKVFFAGNGGSAADSQHLVAELVGRFYLERKALRAEALSVNTSILTAVSNDYDFSRVFARQIEADAEKDDVFFAISTSGNAINVIEAIKICKSKGVFVIGLTGESGGKMKEMCDILINVPSSNTPRIQEAHITIGHIICEIVEARLFGDEKA
ncbi:MAG: D-sedoheptulose-7-phosphate isomerase [Brevinematia bacterium]